MKHRLVKEENELVTHCNQLKLVASDGKRYKTDCLPQNDLLSLIEVVPSQHTISFAKWLITGEDHIDSKSRDKAYQLWDSTLLQSIEVGTLRGLQQIHAYLLEDYIISQGKFAKKTYQKVVFNLRYLNSLDKLFLK